MRLLTTIILVSLAAAILVSSSYFINKVDSKIHQNLFINGLAQYQLLAVILGLLAIVMVFLIKPESKHLLSLGELNTIATKEKWLGINGKTTWLKMDCSCYCL